MACDLERQINDWAKITDWDKEKMEKKDRYKEKFRALFFTLNSARPLFREALLNEEKTTYDIVRMGK